MNAYAHHNDVWNEWIDPEHPPVRHAGTHLSLWRPHLLVEILVSAATK